MAIDIDFSNVERKEGGYALLDEGDYVLTVADAKVKHKEGKDYPTLHLNLECQDSKFMEFLSFHPNSLWRLRQFLEAVSGEPIDGSISIDEKDLISSTFMATVGVKDRDDKPNLRHNYIVAYATPD